MREQFRQFYVVRMGSFFYEAPHGEHGAMLTDNVMKALKASTPEGARSWIDTGEVVRVTMTVDIDEVPA